MIDKSMLIGLAMIAIVVLNIGAFKYVGLFGFIVTAASVPFAHKLLEMIEKL